MINKEYFQWFEKYLAGVTPEFFLALYISFFFCFVAGVRYYLRHYTNTLQEGIETHSNDVAAVLSVIGLLVYLFFIYSSPVSVENLDFGVYTDATVYLFRLAIGVIFIIFFSYTAITSITFSGYKFEYYFVLVVAY
jgi:hypothetical protein